jgi:hypothetical protein
VSSIICILCLFVSPHRMPSSLSPSFHHPHILSLSLSTVSLLPHRIPRDRLLLRCGPCLQHATCHNHSPLPVVCCLCVCGVCTMAGLATGSRPRPRLQPPKWRSLQVQGRVLQVVVQGPKETVTWSVSRTRRSTLDSNAMRRWVIMSSCHLSSHTHTHSLSLSLSPSLPLLCTRVV